MRRRLLICFEWGAHARYWVSATWYEAEPCARDVEPPSDRDWFRRLKVRFDWVEGQGRPWWLSGAKGAASWVAPDWQPAREGEVGAGEQGIAIPHTLRSASMAPEVEMAGSQHRARTPPNTSPSRPPVATPPFDPQAVSSKERDEGWSTGTGGVRLPPTPLSPGKELGQLGMISGPGKIPMSSLMSPPTPPGGKAAEAPLTLPPTPPLDICEGCPEAPDEVATLRATKTAEEVSTRTLESPTPQTQHRATDSDIPDSDIQSLIWGPRPPPPTPSPSPFQDTYFSPLEYHRGPRLPGDHLLANHHPLPPSTTPWQVPTTTRR